MRQETYIIYNIYVGTSGLCYLIVLIHTPVVLPLGTAAALRPPANRVQREGGGDRERVCVRAFVFSEIS